MDISMNIESWKSKKGSREEAAKKRMSNPVTAECLRYESWNGTHDLVLEVGYYPNNAMGIRLYEFTEDGPEPFDTLTTNIAKFPARGRNAYVNTNNMRGALKMITDFHLAEPTGRSVIGNYCAYPEYRFSFKELRKYCINPELLDEMEARWKDE